MKLKLFLFLIIFPITIFAAEKSVNVEKFPNQCRISGLHFSHNAITLFSQHTSLPRLYVINNISTYPIWLTHERKKNPGAGAGWASQIMPRHWSAILVMRRRFDLQCHVQNKSGKMMHVPCQRVIRACQFSEFHSKNPISSGYWVAENISFDALVPHIRARGFSLPIKK